MLELQLTPIEKKLVVELFKSHHTAKEAAEVLGTTYHRVVALYKGLKIAGLDRYDRFSLIQDKEVINHINSSN